MGQRLVITIKEHENNIAAIYYHWSAYSTSALMEAINIIKIINGEPVVKKCLDIGGLTTITLDSKSLDSLDVAQDMKLTTLETSIETLKVADIRLRLIRGLEELGGGVDSADLEEVQKIFPNETFLSSVSRNEGLIALSEKGIEDMLSWSEGDIVIDLDAKSISDDVFYQISTLEEYNEERKQWDEDAVEITDIMSFPQINENFTEIPFEKVEDVYAELCKIDDDFRDAYGNIFCLIV